jgi:MFS transporter, FHS family, L-fucose permease
MAIASPQASSSNNSQDAPVKTNYSAMAMVTTLFFMWGFLTCLNDILIPHLKGLFDLTYTQVMLVQFAFFTSYFVFSTPSGKLIEAVGYKRSMVLGLCTMGIGTILFVPAAMVPSYPLFLTALVILAGGMTILQTSANPYVAVLGPPNTASSRLNLTQAFNSLGTTVAPYFGKILILGAVAAPVAVEVFRKMGDAERHTYQVEQASAIKVPYIGLAIALFVLAVIIGIYKLPVIRSVEGHAQAGESIWQHRHLVLGAVGIFVYVGAEVSIGSFLVNYMHEPNIGNLSLEAAAGYLTYYWGGAMVGRFVGSLLMWAMKLNSGKYLGVNAMVAGILVIVSMVTVGHTAMWVMLAVGFFNSIMFPTIFTLGIDGLGHLTGKGSGLLIAAIIGGAIVPLVQGYFADRMGIHHAFFLPVLCYLFIAFYGFVGSKHGHEAEAR